VTQPLASDVPPDSVLCTAELKRRTSRPPDHAGESRALLALARHLADSPQTILQKLADIALETFRVGSAGISLVSEETGDFYWPAVAGAWQPQIGSGTPRNFGPCGVVLDRNAVQLFARPERYYLYLVPTTPIIHEVLLSPFYSKGNAVGTVWVVAHDEARKFDREDQRLLESLGTFASAAFEMLESLRKLEQEREQLRARDTEQRHLERALQEADRRKDEFLATLAHELRNPLAPIRSSIHRLNLQTQGDTSIGEVTQILDRQVNHMVRLVDDLMDVSRISRGNIELRKEQTSLATIIRSAVDASTPLISAANHQLAISLPSEPVILFGDSVRLSQVISNLLNNAAKYTDRGGQIWLSAERQSGEVVIRVRDNGIGIGFESQQRVFDMFMQVDRSSSRSQSGLGIGLTLVKRLVELHGGTITVQSAGSGKGSEFCLRLPCLETRSSSGPATSIPRDPTALKHRVLVVDDNQDAATSLAMLIKLLGSEAKVANDGTAALTLLDDYQPDVVLLDLGMPRMDGYEVARRIRQSTRSDRVVLIALTGWGQQDDRERTRAAGFDHHLVKPASITELQSLLSGLED
jgi:signal transduction histidine kinase